VIQILRRAPNPWGQDVLLGIGWDLMWAAIVAGVVFLVVHAIFAARARPSGTAPTDRTAPDLPPRIIRHSVGARLFHWTMAAAMLILLVTAFAPVMGYHFDWVTIHWIAGLALIATVVYHVVHVVFWQRLGNVWAGAEEMRDGVAEMSNFVRGRGDPSRKPGKYPVAQKLFHNAATLAAVAAIVTGLFMMVRIDTPVFQQNQYLLGDGAWGVVYVLHGLGGVALIGLVIAHIYFAVRPEKRFLTRSMFKGWITREEYLAHHDPTAWPVDGGKQTAEQRPIAASPSPPPPSRAVGHAP